MQASIGRGALHQYGRTDAICLLILQHAFSSKHSERYFTFEHKSSMWHLNLVVQYPFLDIGELYRMESTPNDVVVCCGEEF